MQHTPWISKHVYFQLFTTRSFGLNIPGGRRLASIHASENLNAW